MATATGTCDIGLIGLAVMGENLVLNMESKGFSVAVFNRTTAVTEKFEEGRAAGKNITATKTMEEFVGALKRPRKAMIMVKAGAPVDAVIEQLVPLLEPGDLIIDGGNSLFTDTQRRCKDLAAKNLHFLGTGVSGGEEGALKGPSIMPGGPKDAWDIIAPVFTKIAAQVDGEACCRYMGPDGAGHYVKMVHNGIEYGDMQLICEAYAILTRVLGSVPRNSTKFLTSGTPATSTASSSRSPVTSSPTRTTKATATSWTRSSTRPGRRAPASGRSSARWTWEWWCLRSTLRWRRGSLPR